MSDIRIVEVYGIKVDARAAVLLETVLDFGGSNSPHKREQADTAVEKLGGMGATKALKCIVDKFSGSNSPHKRELATRAMELI